MKWNAVILCSKVKKFLEKTSSQNASSIRMLSIGLLSVGLRAYVPQVPFYHLLHDDDLFVTQAHNILNGDWLSDIGSITNRTLAKPPGYSIFLAISYKAGIAPTVLLQLLVVLFAYLILVNLIKNGVNRIVAEIGFAMTVASPLWLSQYSSRVYRDYFLACLMLGVVAITLILVNRISSSNNSLRYFMVTMTTSIILGLMLSVIRITKNITFAGWIFFLLPLVVMFFKYGEIQRRKQLLILTVAMTVWVSSIPLVKFVSHVNRERYGVALTNNYTEGSFAKALNVMASVEEKSPRLYVVISRSMRMKMYQVSPTLSRLQPYLETEPNTGWKSITCGMAINICDESASHFPWEIRDAVVLAGLGSTAVEFEKTFEKIATEIEAACKGKKLTCGSKGLAPGISPINNISKRHVLESFMAAIQQTFELSGSDGISASYSSTVSTDTLNLWKETVRSLPKNAPLNYLYPGINSGSELVSLLGVVYKKLWPYFVLLGLIGFLLIDFGRNKKILALGVASLVSAAGLLSQLAISEASIGLFVRGAPGYYLPIYPFIVVACTIGMDLLGKRVSIFWQAGSVCRIRRPKFNG